MKKKGGTYIHIVVYFAFMLLNLKVIIIQFFKSFFIEGLTVLGWVSLRNPVQIFLYEIWPIIHNRRILERALKADVEFTKVDTIPDDLK